MTGHLHFMGIGGVIMSALARYAQQDGCEVSGCDLARSPETERLEAQGIAVAQGHDPAHIQGVTTLVHTNAVAPDHPEVVAARAAGCRTLGRIELLAELFAARRGVAVTGTHGKSTTTGMTASAFLGAGADPGVLVGAHLPLIEGNMRHAASDWLIAEVDESDPGFADIHADLAMITNLSDDHIAGSHNERRTYHATVADLETAMRRFAGHARLRLICADWPELIELLSDMDNVSYGLEARADYRIEEPVLQAASSTFVLLTPEGSRYPVTLAVPGLHNVQNATAALAAVHLAGLGLEPAITALAGFRGVGRRWQRQGSVRGALFIDDYAVHPNEVRVVLQMARNTGRRVRAVLQPHRWVRTAQHWPALADAVSTADEVLVLDIYAAGEDAIAGISSQLIVARLQAAGKRVRHVEMKGAEAYLAESLGANDLVLTLGAGDVWRVGQRVVAALGGDDDSA